MYPTESPGLFSIDREGTPEVIIHLKPIVEGDVWLSTSRSVPWATLGQATCAVILGLALLVVTVQSSGAVL